MASNHENVLKAYCLNENIVLNNTTTRSSEDHQARIAKSTNHDLLNTLDDLFTDLSANMSHTHEMFNQFQNSIDSCGNNFQIMLKNIENINSIWKIPETTSQVPQETKDKLDEVVEPENTEKDTSRKSPKYNFSLPAKYNPNDTRWTLKYQINKRGLTELMPRGGIYVKKKGLQRCIRLSKDCKSLAQMLLEEVFDRSALRVCSWTGGKAKAYKAVNVVKRPGLDEHARTVLLAFIHDHGTRKGWNTDTGPIVTGIRTKIRACNIKGISRA